MAAVGFRVAGSALEDEVIDAALSVLLGAEDKEKEHEEDFDEKVDTTTICGPDVTKWFAEELNIHAAFFRKARGSIGRALRAFYFYEYARTIPHKWTNFDVPGCPVQCRGTVMLCNTCISKTELGNIMFGAIAHVFGFDALAVSIGIRVGAIDQHEDMAGVVGGVGVGALLAKDGARINGDQLCEQLSSDSSERIKKFIDFFDPKTKVGRAAHDLLEPLGPNLLDEMGRKYKACRKCGSPAWSGKHSDMSSIDTTEKLARFERDKHYLKVYEHFDVDWEEKDPPSNLP